MRFKSFLTESMDKLPNLMNWVRSFFQQRMDPQALWVYGDWLEENGNQPAADFFHQLVQWRNPRLKTGTWQGNLIQPFHDLFGWPGPRGFFMTESGTSWFIHPSRPSAHVNSPYTSGDWRERDYNTMSRHIVYPGETSYRLSLTNGQWAAHTNDTDSRVSVVSTRHQPTEDSERHFPQGRVSLKDYKSVDIAQVPDAVLQYAFYHIIEKQIRGGH